MHPNHKRVNEHTQLCTRSQLGAGDRTRALAQEDCSGPPLSWGTEGVLATALLSLLETRAGYSRQERAGVLGGPVGKSSIPPPTLHRA